MHALTSALDWAADKQEPPGALQSAIAPATAVEMAFLELASAWELPLDTHSVRRLALAPAWCLYFLFQNHNTATEANASLFCMLLHRGARVQTGACQERRPDAMARSMTSVPERTPTHSMHNKAAFTPAMKRAQSTDD
jgi:hypothetical protein